MAQIRPGRLLPVLAAGWMSAAATAALGAAPERLPDGMLVAVGGGFLKIEVCAEDVVRVAFAKDRAFFSRASLVAAPKRCGRTRWGMETENNVATLQTTRFDVRVDLVSGAEAIRSGQGDSGHAQENCGED